MTTAAGSHETTTLSATAIVTEGVDGSWVGQSSSWVVHLAGGYRMRVDWSPATHDRANIFREPGTPLNRRVHVNYNVTCQWLSPLGPARRKATHMYFVFSLE